MHRFAVGQPVCSALLTAILLGTSLKSALAADAQKEILDGLRREGHYQAAIDYLQHTLADTATPQAFAETIPYELALTRIDAAARLAGPQRDNALQLAQEALTKFLADRPRHALAGAAAVQLGNVLLDRGRSQRMLGQQYEGQGRQKLMEAARGLLQQAIERWAEVDKRAEEELKHIGFVRDELQRSEARDQIHRRQLQARLGGAWAQYEMGQTYPPQSNERTAALEDAGKRFDLIYDQQRDLKLLAGFYARLGRGLCWKDLGEAGKAFAVFEELLGLPDDPADFHVLRGKAAVQALETSLRPEVKKFKEAVDIAQHWVAGDHPATTSTEVDLAVRFLGGEATLSYVKGQPPASPEQRELRTRQIDWARQQFGIVAAAAGPYQAKAKIRLLDPAFGTRPTSEPGSFGDALNHAAAALERFRGARLQQQEASRTGMGNDPDSQRQRRQQIDAARTEAIKYCRLALTLHATPPARQTPEDYDAVRYCLAYLHYASDDLEEAATLGETVARESSECLAARQAATIGLAAGQALLRHAAAASRPAALERLQALAETIIRRWGDRAEADDARASLLDLALESGRLEDAQQYLDEISAGAPRRGEAELNVGRALWQQAQRLLRSSTLEHNHIAEADRMTAHAASLLDDGIARVRKARDAGLDEKENAAGAPPVQEAGDTFRVPEVIGTRHVPEVVNTPNIPEAGGTPSVPDMSGLQPANQGAAADALAAAMLALAQIRMTDGQPAEAAGLLEDPAVAASEDSTSLSLLAYVAAGQLDRAKTCLRTLQTLIPTDTNTNASRQLLRSCLRINRLLKHYLTGYRNRRQDDLVKKIVEQFEIFLVSPADGPEAASFFTLAWRAEAYAGLAQGLDGGGPAVLPQAEKQYRQAVAAFREILDRSATDAQFSPAAEAVIALRIELARCLRRLSDNAQALSQLLAVLKDHPQMVDAQVEAAYTYQSWGDDKPEYLEMAIQGGKRYSEVWGWGELARRVQSEARFRDVFHEARYNLALCRFHQSQMATERAQRARLAEAAENDVLATQRSFPDMGGGVWYDRYNELLKRIQRLADRPAVGLPTGQGNAQK